MRPIASRPAESYSLPLRKLSDYSKALPRFKAVPQRRTWRCTDIGTRTITAMRIDSIEVVTSAPDRHQTRRTLSHSEAAAEGWFNGPPYAAAESVFDENDLGGCSLEPDDVAATAEHNQ
jgi:hypothetical protein